MLELKLTKIRLPPQPCCSACLDDIRQELELAPVERAIVMALRGGRVVDRWEYSDNSTADVTVDVDDVRRRLTEVQADAAHKSHNHPAAAVVYPSRDDVRWVREFLTMLAAEKIRLSDYLIVGPPGAEAFSLYRATADPAYGDRMRQQFEEGLARREALHDRLCALRIKGAELQERWLALERRDG